MQVERAPITLTIYGDPRTKKNSQMPLKMKNGRVAIIPSKPYREYLRDAVIVGKRPMQPVDRPVNVSMAFHTATRRKVDLSNLEAGCLDLLVHYGVLADDNCSIVVSQDGSRVVQGVGKDCARVEVEIRDAARGVTA